MSDVETDPKPQQQDGWLDTWLSEVAKTDNMRLRANAAIALATLGGPARIEEFIELVGDTALKMKDGRPGAAEAVAVALREVERPDFDREALTRAFERTRNDDRPEHQAARALLMPAHPVVAWWRLRGVAAWGGWWRTLNLAAPLALGAMTILLVSMWLLIDRRGGTNILGGDNGLYLIFLFFGAVLGSVAIARVAVAGQRTRVGLALDGLLCGVVGASPLLLVLLSAATDKTRDGEPHVVPLLWGTFAAAVLALASVRVYVGVSLTGRRRLPAVLSAIAWPVATLTMAALAAAWTLGKWPGPGMDLVQGVISWTWVTFVVAAPAVAVGIGAADDLRRTNVSPFWVFRPPNPAVLLGVAFIVVVSLVTQARKPAHEFTVTADEVSGPFKVTNDQRFALIFPKGSPEPGKDGLEVAFDSQSKGYVLGAGDGDYLAAQGEPDAKPPYVDADDPPAQDAPSATGPPLSVNPAIDDGRFNSQLTQPSMTPLGRHFLLQARQTEDLCMVKRKHRRCGVPSAQVSWWLQILTGRTERLGDHRDLYFYVYRPTPPRAEPVVTPDQSPRAWRLTASGAFTTVLRPSEARPALQIAVQRPYYLRVRPTSADKTLDRVVVVQQVDSKDSYVVWSADDPDPPQLSMLLQPNRNYLVCLRLVHAMFLDCTHQTRGLLAEDITLTLAQARPAELGPASATLTAGQPTAATIVGDRLGSRP